MPAPRDRIIELHKRYLEEGLTLAEAGAIAGEVLGHGHELSRERVRQIFNDNNLKVLTRKERGEMTRRRNRGVA